MSDRGHHCPFLNRADARCSDFFSLERLDHAFGFCFNEYAQCRIYLELLVERRVRRMTGRVVSPERADGSPAAGPLVQITLHGRPAEAVAHRYGQRAA